MFISAYLIRNYLNNDPLLDWLELYGEKKGFKKDDIQSVFLQFLSQKKHQFKQKNIDSILNRIKSLNLKCFEIDVTLSVRRRIAKTIDQMYLGSDIIVRGGVYHQTTSGENWYMVPDILIKKSQIKHVFPELNVSTVEMIPEDCYIPIIISYLTLRFSRKQETFPQLLNDQKLKYYKCLSQLAQTACLSMYDTINNLNLSNSIISKSVGIIIGRSNSKHRDDTIKSCVVLFNKDLYRESLKAINWINRINSPSSSDWNIYPPSTPELYPNMRNGNEDYPWHQTKKIIAQKLNDITLLWQCGPQQRYIAHQKGIFQWNQIDDSGLDLSLGDKKSQIVNKMITINRKDEETAGSNLIYTPRKIKNSENIEKIREAQLEFYVDFETVQEPDDGDTSNGGGFLFMIGCVTRYQINSQHYHCEYKSFVVNKLTRLEEKKITREWIDYMSHFQKLYPHTQPKLYHWSPAEPVIYQQLSKKWRQILPLLNFIDLLQIFQSEPIVIKGAFSYSLKEISRALYHHKYLKTLWNDNVVDGKDAMIQAWMCYQPSQSHQKTEVLNHIEHYNYVDCKVMEEIMSFVRQKLL